MELIINTDPKLPPKVRYYLVINEHLQNDLFKYLKSKNSFVKETPNGRIELKLSFVHTINLIHGVGYSFHYIFDDIEKESWTRMCKPKKFGRQKIKNRIEFPLEFKL
jgi:hypothetical protein